MRLLPIALAASLAACGTNEPANSSSANQNGPVASPASDAASPDRPVSSDDRPITPPPQPDMPTPDCPISGSSDWHAHVDAMPGPNRQPQLNVTGKVTVPTGGYTLALRMGQVAESYPVQVTVYLDATPPSGPATQALETREVRGTWPSEERVGSVTIRCGRQVLARLSNIETAR